MNVNSEIQKVELRMTPEGMELEIAPELYTIAAEWPLYASTTERPCGVIHPPVTGLGGAAVLCQRVHVAHCYRCRKCEEEVFPADEIGILRHMFTSHGFRMNGRRYDNQNQEIPLDA